jgi:asparaginyl-tRNA synthetase
LGGAKTGPAEAAHLARTKVIGAVTRVRHSVARAIHRFFDEHGFFWVNTPIITAPDAKGARTLFRVSTLANLPRTPHGKVDFARDFFHGEALLTVSGQFNVEPYCLALTKVYTFGPTFRANTTTQARPGSPKPPSKTNGNHWPQCRISRHGLYL